MLNDVFQPAWEVAWRRRDTWWLVLWLGLLSLAATSLLAALLAAAHVPFGAVPAPSLFPARPPYGGLGPPTAGAPPWLGGAGGAELLGVAGVVLLLGGFVVLPFAAAGSYGVVARALRSPEPMGAAAFWQEGWRNWSRGYGLLLLGLAILALAVLAGVILFAVLHLLGGLGVVLAVLGTVAVFLLAAVWGYWSAAHLFMGPWPWAQAFGQGLVDAWTYKWPSLGILVVLSLGASLVNALPTPLEQLWLPLGLVVAGALSGWVSLFASAVSLGFHVYGERRAG